MAQFFEYITRERNSYSAIVDALSKALRNTHKKVEIGNDDLGLPIYLWESYQPKYLITAGWQGDEPAGWNACLDLVESDWEGLKSLSFMPIACPSSMVLRSHFDSLGYNSDRDFPNPQAESSRAIVKVTDLLVSLAPIGHFSLQEDPHRSFAYAYSWGDSPIQKVIKILDNGPRSGMVMWDKGERVPKHDGMFCEHLQNHGVPFSIQTETPADGTVSLRRRTDAQVDVVRTLAV